MLTGGSPVAVHEPVRLFAEGITTAGSGRLAPDYSGNMRDPEALYELTPDAVGVPAGLHLIAGLTGFADAGGGVTQLSEYLIESIDHRLIATFDADELLAPER
jgi:hypothetical protein